MKKISIIIVGVFLGIFLLLAPAKAKVQMDVFVQAWSKYLTGSSGLVVHDGWVIQTTVYAFFPKGFYASLFHSIGLDDDDPSSNLGDEIDYVGGWRYKPDFKLSALKDVEIDFSLSYFDVDSLLSTGGPISDVFQPALRTTKYFILSNGEHVVAPYLLFEFAFPIRDLPSGVYVTAGVNYFWQISDKFDAGYGLRLVYDNGAYGFDPGALVGGFANLNWWPWGREKGFSLSLNLKGSVPAAGMEDRSKHTAYGLGASYSW